MWVYPVAQREAGEPLKKGELLSLQVWGKIGRSTGLGMLSVGKNFLGFNNPAGGIYQRRHSNPKAHNYRGLPGIKPKVIMMRTYQPTNPRTELQQANRAKYAAGVLAWQALTVEEKTAYNKPAAKLGFSGYNLFMRKYLLGH